jgi:hypothetical protein
MTTVAMIFGMLPVAFGVGEGAETRSPMGVSVIGGLLTSLFLTLAVVPAAYDLFDDGQEWLKRGEYRKLATRDYWRVRVSQIPGLLGKIRRAPAALWKKAKTVPVSARSLGAGIAARLARGRDGKPPESQQGPH